MRTEVSAISFIGTSLLDEGWCSCSPPRACFKAVAAFFSTGHSLGTLVAQLMGPLKPRSFSAHKRDDQRYESSLDSDNLLCAIRLCILSDTMRNGMHSISHGVRKKMGGTCPSKLCRTYPLCGYEARSLTLSHAASACVTGARRCRTWLACR